MLVSRGRKFEALEVLLEVLICFVYVAAVYGFTWRAYTGQRIQVLPYSDNNTEFEIVKWNV